MIDFSDRENARKELESIVKKEPEELEENVYDLVQLNREELVPQLYNAAVVLKNYASFVKNIGIENKKEEKQRFLELWKKDEPYEPEFEFREFPYNEEVLIDIIDELIGQCQKIGQEEIERYGFQEVSAVELQEFWQEIFEEFNLYVKLAANIESEEKWRHYSLQIWPMVEEETVENSRKRLEEGFDVDKKEETVTPEQLKEMFEEELEDLGIDYTVEVRPIKGCHNIPEEKILVVGSGENEGEMYTKERAETVAVHEAFHVVRGFNGNRAAKNDFPPVLGMHTPFYDQTEEGGAILREHLSGSIYPEKERDYHLRLMTAYFHSQKMDFQEVIEKVVELGATPERAFELAARNREFLRHHIYQGGYYEEWKDREEKWPLLVGKLSSEWSERFRKEVETSGAIREPEVGKEQLFQ